MDMPQDHKFNGKLLWNHSECVIAAAVCFVLAARQKRLREIAFPLVLLLTLSIVHGIHRPWWNYYYFHFDIPLAWLAGWAVSEVAGMLWASASPRSSRPSILRSEKNSSQKRKSALTPSFVRSTTEGGPSLSPRRELLAISWQTVGLCVLVAVPVAKSERRLEGAIKDIRGRQAANENPIVRKMREYSDRTHWVYSQSGIYPFHAGLTVIPELAIVMPKRFWSGQISTAQIVEVCKRYKAEIVVLPKETLSSEWANFLNLEFEFSLSDGTSLLYLSKRLQGK